MKDTMLGQSGAGLDLTCFAWVLVFTSGLRSTEGIRAR